MSNTKWTPEPWTVADIGTHRFCRVQDTKDYGVACTEWGGVFESERPTAQANAARIVSCVNACAGLSDPAEALKAAREAIKMLMSHAGTGSLSHETAMRAGKNALALLGKGE